LSALNIFSFGVSDIVAQTSLDGIGEKEDRFGKTCMTDEFFPQTFTWGASCPSCKTALPSLGDIAAVFFQSGAVPCPKCGKGVDIWQATKESVRTHPGSLISLAELGANQTVFFFELDPGETKNLDFTEYGVPQAAVVVSVNYTPQGTGCFAVEFHGNDGRRRSHKPNAIVYGATLGGEPPGPAKIATMITWVNETEQPESWTMLADAFQAAADNRFSRVVVPAYSAFEVSLSRLIRDLLLRMASKESVDEFMVKDLSAAGALNVLLPFISKNSGLKDLPDDIRGKLTRLRRLRNRALHEGLRDADLDRSEVGELLCAAVFGFEFVQYARSRVFDANAS